jgi:hypothetical protein
VLELIEDLGVAARRRGRADWRDPTPHEGAPRSRPNVLSRMGFVRAAHSAEGLPPPPLAEIAFAGRSNVGKSSLLNALAAGKASGKGSTVGIASVANKPGAFAAGSLCMPMEKSSLTRACECVLLPLAHGRCDPVSKLLRQWVRSSVGRLARVRVCVCKGGGGSAMASGDARVRA